MLPAMEEIHENKDLAARVKKNPERRYQSNPVNRLGWLKNAVFLGRGLPSLLGCDSIAGGTVTNKQAESL